jgi:ryanodine receptor 2
LETAGSVLNYFEPFLGRIEILGGSKRIERVYFEIKESNIEQWEKPQIKVKGISLIYLSFHIAFYPAGTRIHFCQG